jgi:hypothetical protein
MGWDVLLFHLPYDVTSVHEIPACHSSDPLGRRRDAPATVRPGSGLKQGTRRGYRWSPLPQAEGEPGEGYLPVPLR